MAESSDVKAKPSIVVVEDDDSVLEVLQVYFERHGYPVVATADPVEALKAAEGLRDEVWLIDMKLPQMSGLALAELVSKRGTARLLVIMTGFPDDELPARVNNIPRATFLRKPLGFKELNALLERHIG